jgi:hypothetical protein
MRAPPSAQLKGRCLLLHGAPQLLSCTSRSGGHKSRNRYIAGMKRRSFPFVFAGGIFWVLTSTMAIAGECLSHPAPFRLQSDTVQWSMVIARGDECIQGLRGKTMIIESISLVEQPKRGRVIVQGPSFRYFAGPEAGPDSFQMVIVGSSVRISGTSAVRVEVQVR